MSVGGTHADDLKQLRSMTTISRRIIVRDTSTLLAKDAGVAESRSESFPMSEGG